MPNKGTARLPVSGFITVGYGTTDEIGAYSQGIKLEARPGSLAVAPMGGIVRFAGQFKNYGNMVIIEHKNGYHSLIAGLHRIDAPVEGRINAGEPIGQLPLTSSRGGRPALYYELRRNGQPVNPADMIADLKS
ncbi:MAG: peptidoglycan DD-metalloendopeptidase family protein [Rhodospirillales bacterium]|nr:peptidoglycan DD-metalloendopeptidase family protein [Rhodospirillales bacterium]